MEQSSQSHPEGSEGEKSACEGHFSKKEVSGRKSHWMPVTSQQKRNKDVIPASGFHDWGVAGDMVKAGLVSGQGEFQPKRSEKSE